MPERPAHDEIEVLKGQVAALSHCLNLALTILNDLSGNAVLDWARRATIVTDSDLRREGIHEVLQPLLEVLERHNRHDGDGPPEAAGSGR